MRQNWKYILKAYFTFNYYEKVMVWVFLVLILVLSTLTFLTNRNTNVAENPLKNNQSLIDSLEELIAVNKEKAETKTKQTQTPFYFNPNKVDRESLIKLGFYPKLADRLIKYRAKNPFKRPEDLNKLYGISEELVERLTPYMTFDKPQQVIIESKDIAKNSNEEIPYTIELNIAEPEELMLMKGVGKTLGKRIYTYREKLGGFVTPWQLLEVWGIDSSLVINNNKMVTIDETKIHRIPINSAEWKDLVKHPYIQSREASLIINYRTLHGKYNSVEDLKKIKVLKDDFIEKISPYLQFD
ncbi:MAG: helix-hairpin-helix domain-containing protein [Bacteroidetes bacterium]|nr:helix-hairpin-helix domain-containing protein [Bacteroidota bacterium]